MAEPRYRAVSSPSGRWQVFDRDRVMADCPGGPEDAERIAAALNEMDKGWLRKVAWMEEEREGG